MTKVKLKELDKLAALLEAENIPYEKYTWDIGEETCHMVVSPNMHNRKVDAVCHSFSYGGKQGLLEVLGSANINLPNDDVKGWMTANEAFQYFTEM